MNFIYKLKNYYNNLSNRKLWIIILLVIFFIWYIFYWYLFSYNLINVKIHSNVSNYDIFLKSEKYWKKYFFHCSKKDCILENISPFNYELKISKSNYNDFSLNFNPKDKSDLNIFLKKEVLLKPLEKEKIKVKNISRKEKIEEIKLEKSSYWYKKYKWDIFTLKELWNDKLELIYNNKIVWVLNKVPKEKISLFKVINSDSYYYLILWSDTYLVNTQYFILTKLKLKLFISYIKKLNNNFLLITTRNWSFLYNLKNKNISYFNSLYDFIILDSNTYIGILKDSVINQKKNLWFWNTSWDLIVKYNLKEKTANLLKKVDFDIAKIYKDNFTIIVEDKNWNKYELINY